MEENLPHFLRTIPGAPDRAEHHETSRYGVLLHPGPGPLSHVSEFAIRAAGKINFTAPLTMVGAFDGMSTSSEMNDAVFFVGEVALLAGVSSTPVTIESVTDCLIAYLPVSTFDAWLQQDLHLLRPLSEHVAAKLYCSSYSRGERLFYSDFMAGSLTFFFIAIGPIEP